MIINICIEDCLDCPFHDSGWGCNLGDLGLTTDCPFDDKGDNEIIIKNTKEKGELK